MQPTDTSATAPAKTPSVAFVLNVPRLEILRKAHGIETNEDLARVIGVNPATLHRVSVGKVNPSNGFMAAVSLAFPSTSFDQLFLVTVNHAKAA